MDGRNRTRERDHYEAIVAAQRAERERSYTGHVVVRGRDLPWIQGRQGVSRTYLSPSRYMREPVETAIDGWICFVQEVRLHSGKHRHQGGLVIYIIAGKGHTVCDGARLDWEAGDLLLLPIKRGGVEHQHFNADPEVPVKWIAFINTAIYNWGASEMVQLEAHPEFRGFGPRRRARR